MISSEKELQFFKFLIHLIQMTRILKFGIEHTLQIHMCKTNFEVFITFIIKMETQWLKFFSVQNISLELESLWITRALAMDFNWWVQSSWTSKYFRSSEIFVLWIIIGWIKKLPRIHGFKWTHWTHYYDDPWCSIPFWFQKFPKITKSNSY